jgi:hypothetical protein
MTFPGIEIWLTIRRYSAAQELGEVVAAMGNRSSAPAPDAPAPAPASAPVPTPKKRPASMQPPSPFKAGSALQGFSPEQQVALLAELLRPVLSVAQSKAAEDEEEEEIPDVDKPLDAPPNDYLTSAMFSAPDEPSLIT